MTRLAANLLIAVSILFLPWWFTLTAFVVSLFLIERMYEVVLWALLADLLYGVPLSRFLYLEFVFALTSLLLLLCVESVKRRLIFYNH